MNKEPLLKLAVAVLSISYAEFGLQFLGQILMSRLLSVEDYGIFSALSSVAVLFTLFSVSYPLIVVKNLSQVATKNPEHVWSCIVQALIRLSVVLLPFALMVMLASPQIMRFFHLSNLFPILIVITVYTLGPFVSSLQAVLQGLQLYVENSIISLGITTLKLALGVTFVLFCGARYWGIFSGLLIASLLALMVLHSVLNKHVVKSNSAVSYSFSFSGWQSAILISVGMSTLIGFDQSLARHFLEPVEAGLYAAASLTAKIVMMVSAPFVNMIVPEVSRAHLTGKSHHLRKLIALSVGIAFATWLMVSLMPTFVLSILVGAKYLEATRLVPVSAGIGFCIAIVSLMNQYCFALGIKKYFYTLYSSIFCGIGAVALFFHGSAMELACGILGTAMLAIVAGLGTILIRSETR